MNIEPRTDPPSTPCIRELVRQVIDLRKELRRERAKTAALRSVQEDNLRYINGLEDRLEDLGY